MHRARAFVGHVDGSASTSPISATPTAATSSLGTPGVKADDDIVIVSALRTAIGKARRGGFKDTFVEDLLGSVLKATIDKTGIDPKLVGDVVVGTVLGSGSQRANECRIAALMAGLPDTVPIHIINRQCSSG